MSAIQSLDGVSVAQTQWSLVDGKSGRLIVCGQDLQELVATHSFESLVEMMLPHTAPLGEKLGQARGQLAQQIWDDCQLGGNLPSIEVQRIVVDRLEANSSNDLQLIAAMGLSLVYQLRQKRGLPFMEPRTNLSHSQDLMRLCGQPSPEFSAALQTYLVTVAEHGMNASTFTARVVASTRAGHKASISAALCALQGPLHGGAPGPVLDMLDLLADHQDPQSWLEQQILQGERLMGFGHRIYKVRDPRAEVLGQAAGKLCSGERFEQAKKVEQLARLVLQKHKPGRALETNVEYYTALLLDALGFERDQFTAVFASGRVLGWLAHAQEQETTGRLIRPECQYIGPIPNQPQ